MLKNRILAGWIIAFTIGIGIGLYTEGKIRIAGFAILGVLCGLLLAAHHFCSFNVKKPATVCFLVIIGMAYSAVYTVIAFSGASEYSGKKDTVTAEVKDIKNYADGGYFDISLIESTAGLGKGTGIRLYYTGILTDENSTMQSSVKTGDTISCSLTYKRHNKNSLYSKGIYLTAQGSVDKVIAGSGFFYDMRNNAENTADRLFCKYPDKVGAVAKTLTVGETADMDPYIYELFRNGGVSHLLVISGLHISVIVMSLYGLLKFFTVRRQIRSIICLAVLFLYAFFVGFTPSVSRAVIMTGIMFLCTLAIRRADSITSLFLALFILLLINPYNLFSVSLELSFLSCLGILIISPHLMRPVKGRALRAKKIFKAVVAPMLYTLAATIFTFPVLLVFNSISYISPLTNLIIAPVFTYLLIFLVPSILLFAVFGAGTNFLAFIPGKIIQHSCDILEKFYEADIGRFSTYIPYMFLPLIFALAVIFTLCFLRRRKMHISAGVFTLCFIASIIFCIADFNIQSKKAGITALNDSYAYKSLFAADGEKNFYIDLGGKKSGISSVYKHGYCYLNYYVMNSISQADIAKLENALAQINIENIYVPVTDLSEKGNLEKIKMLAKKRGCGIIKYNTFIFENIGYSSIEIKRNSDYRLSENFFAVIKRSGKNVAVYGGAETGSSEELEYSDAVILLGTTEEVYRNIYCASCCLKLDGYNKMPELDIQAEKIYDYSETDYARIILKDKAVEVNLDEP